MNDHAFPFDPLQAIKNGCAATEEEFLRRNSNPTDREYDKSGSCAVFALFIDSKIYVGNVGDSRALVVTKKGGKCLTRDHKPDNEME